jgi:hypothetical protein
MRNINPTYTTTAVEATQITALLKAKAADLNWYTKTLRNAIRAAKRQGRDFYVTRTAGGAFINTGYDIADAAGCTLDFIARANGTVEKAVWA